MHFTQSKHPRFLLSKDRATRIIKYNYLILFIIINVGL